MSIERRPIAFFDDATQKSDEEQKMEELFKKYRTGELLTQKQVEAMFDVTPTTIHNWRKKSQFPVHHLNSPGLKKPPVRFDKGEITFWAELNNIPIVAKNV